MPFPMKSPLAKLNLNAVVKESSTYKIQNRIAGNANDINPFSPVNITLKIPLSVYRFVQCAIVARSAPRVRMHSPSRLTIKDLKMRDQLQFRR
jgi:hypothetical protein